MMSDHLDKHQNRRAISESQKGRSCQRKLTFLISDDAGDMTVREFLSQKLHFSRKQISSLKYREDGIRVNGVMSRVSRVLKTGDCLEIVPKTAGSLYLDHGNFTSPPDILYEDQDLLIVNKPAGMVCHPSPGHYADSLANQVAAYAAKNNEDWTIRLVGRLDKDTSGIVIFAKNSEAAALLSGIRRGPQNDSKSIEKTYYAIVEGHPGTGTVNTPIGQDPNVLGKMRTDPYGKPAVTFYEEIKTIQEENGLKDIVIAIEAVNSGNKNTFAIEPADSENKNAFAIEPANSENKNAFVIEPADSENKNAFAIEPADSENKNAFVIESADSEYKNAFSGERGSEGKAGSEPAAAACVGTISLVRLHLTQGRTHQIRLHMSSIGCPLVGDSMYGHGIKGSHHAFLHCREAALVHPFTGESIVVTASFPADWSDTGVLFQTIASPAAQNQTVEEFL